MPDSPHVDPASAADPLSRRGFLRSTGLVAATLAAGGVAAAQAPLAPPDKQPEKLALPEARKRARWAVVGLGELAVGEILPAFGLTQRSKLTALVSGHRDKATRFAQAYAVDPRALYSYDNFDTLADNPEVDVVYIVLPNHLHAEYTIRALKAGKHVLCEKPMAPTADECRRMIEASQQTGKKLMIAYRLRYEPFHMKAIEIMRSGELGTPRLFEAANMQNTQAPNIRLSKETAGGPVGDVGIYCLNAARYLLGEEPEAVSAFAVSPAEDRFREVPGHVAFQMRFPSGALAISGCGFDSTRSDRLRVTCEKGYLELDPAFSYRGQRLTVFKDGKESVYRIEPKNHFAQEMDHFSECVLDDKPPRTPGEEGLRDLQVIEKIYDSYNNNGRPAAIAKA